MRTVVTGVLGLIGGFLVGIMLLEGGPGIELLPIVLAALAYAVAAPLVDSRLRRRPRRAVVRPNRSRPTRRSIS